MYLKIVSHTKNYIKGLKAPRNVTKVNLFLDLSNVFGRLVSNSARTASLLNDKLQHDQPFNSVLNEKELQWMSRLQQRLFFSLVMALLFAEGLITLDTDVCEV